MYISCKIVRIIFRDEFSDDNLPLRYLGRQKNCYSGWAVIVRPPPPPPPPHQNPTKKYTLIFLQSPPPSGTFFNASLPKKQQLKKKIPFQARTYKYNWEAL